MCSSQHLFSEPAKGTRRSKAIEYISDLIQMYHPCSLETIDLLIFVEHKQQNDVYMGSHGNKLI